MSLHEGRTSLCVTTLVVLMIPPCRFVLSAPLNPFEPDDGTGKSRSSNAIFELVKLRSMPTLYELLLVPKKLISWESRDWTSGVPGVMVANTPFLKAVSLAEVPRSACFLYPKVPR